MKVFIYRLFYGVQTFYVHSNTTVVLVYYTYDYNNINKHYMPVLHAFPDSRMTVPLNFIYNV